MIRLYTKQLSGFLFSVILTVSTVHGEEAKPENPPAEDTSEAGSG